MFIIIYIEYFLLFGINIDFWICNIMQNLQNKPWIIDLDDVSYDFSIKIDIDLDKKIITL